MSPRDPLPIEPAEAFDVTLRPPGSKSLTNRALVMAALARGTSKLTGVLLADDTRRMIEALRALGFRLKLDEDACRVTIKGGAGSVPRSSAELDLGNAGTAMRFLTAMLTLGLGEYTLDGIARMRQRPIGELVDPLNELGADIEYLGETGFPPLKVIAEPPGPIGGLLEMAPTLSSQFISALLMIGPYLQQGLEIEFDGPVTSLPYVKMTLNLMKQFGAEFEADTGYRAINVPGLSHGSGGFRGYDYPVEPDASNASYFLAAAAVVPGSRCVIEGLGSRSLQGDAEFCDVLGRMGCGVDQRLDTTCVTAPADGKLRAVDVDLNDMPDMAQTLAVVALFADPGSGPTMIRNVGNLRVKETDRIAALENELAKFGAKVTTVGDDLTVHPPDDPGLHEVRVETYDDHRMAMAFAVAGLRRPNVTILDPRCVEKTFPDYFAFLDRLRGAAV
ncbi:MAG: 3-phosphoshikimate 1-carboxyvinyltransferase [Planctomycetota bacterium]